MRLALLLLVAAACRARGYTIAPLTRVALTDAFSANGNGVYQTYVGVALNGQPGFTLLVDTGSSNLVVAGSGCASCAAQGVWPLFDVGQSPIVLGPASGAYGTGAQTYSGSLVAASVSVGGTSAVAVAVSVFVNQSLFFGGDYRFVAGNATAGAPSSEQGILGVGPPDLAAPGGDWLVQYLANAGETLFALELCQTNGSMYLGGYPGGTAAFTPSPAESYDLFEQGTGLGYYNIEVLSLGLAGQPSGAPPTLPVILDSGTGNSAVEPALFDAVVAGLEAPSPAAFIRAAFNATPKGLFNRDGLYSYDFSSSDGGANVAATGPRCWRSAATAAQLNAALPHLVVVLAGGVRLSVPAVPGYLSYYNDGAEGNRFCGTLSSSGPNPGMSILGWPFMSAFIVVFDVSPSGPARIGFAPSTACGPAAGVAAVSAPPSPPPSPPGPPNPPPKPPKPPKPPAPPSRRPPSPRPPAPHPPPSPASPPARSPPPCSALGLAANNVSGVNNTVLGCGNSVHGNGLTVEGFNNVVEGSSDTVVGSLNVVAGAVFSGAPGGSHLAWKDHVYGDSNRHARNAHWVTSSENTVVGDQNVIKGNSFSNEVVGSGNVLRHQSHSDVVVGTENSLFFDKSDFVNGSFNVVSSTSSTTDSGSGPAPPPVPPSAQPPMHLAHGPPPPVPAPTHAPPPPVTHPAPRAHGPPPPVPRPVPRPHGPPPPVPRPTPRPHGPPPPVPGHKPPPPQPRPGKG